jgi:hypothetical protein
MAPADEPFLGRWSRLKREGRRHEPAPGDAPEEESAEPVPAATEPAAGDEETAPLDLPDIETLDKDSDYSQFMKEGVPEALKKLALRKLWLSDPDLAVLDGLNDYDEDFRIPEAILGEIAKGGDETPEAADDAGAGAKAKDEKDEQDEVAAAKGAADPGDADAPSEPKDQPGADAGAAEQASESADDSDDSDGKSG